MDIKERLRKARQAKRLSIAKLSEIINAPTKTISNYELGQRKVSVEYLALLHDHLGVNYNYLISGKGEIYIDKSQEEKEEIYQVIKERFNLNDDEIKRIIDEATTNPKMRELFAKIIDARHGKKEAFDDIYRILNGMELMTS
ncbi:MAG: Transcriptional regulator [uncultured bacterium]|nr:MAG: Transcriptional regulator [uncultured bacterium]HBH18523.1 hypothetical protein [Cyanobacteria bacterium UBA9579]